MSAEAIYYFSVFGLLWAYLRLQGLNLDGTECYCNETTMYTINRAEPSTNSRIFIFICIALFMIAVALIWKSCQPVRRTRDVCECP
jgi:amino acid permease